MSEFPCGQCSDLHSQQAFISHSQRDSELADLIAGSCCDAGTAPYLFERDRSDKRKPADWIRRKIIESRLHFVMLGPGVSCAFWTQSWIGFEIGVTRGYDFARDVSGSEYFTKQILVLEDVRQGTEVSVPYLHEFLLFDFEDKSRWQEFEDVVRFFARTDEESDLDFWRVGNRLRGNLLRESGVTCTNTNCKSTFEVWVAKEDIGKLRSVRRMGPATVCSIKCPSCANHVICRLGP